MVRTFRAERPVSRDAVVVLPGIMGSELVDAETRKVLWGLADPVWYVRAWLRGEGLGPLYVTEDEREGRVGRVQATHLLRAAPAFAPVLRGFEPYSDLLAGLRRVVADEAAVLEFSYDWRLSVEYNAGLLALEAQKHLERWQANPHGDRDARLVLVAHSMGGLIGRYFMRVLGGEPKVRALVTIGTPFFGAVKAAHLLSTGQGAPLRLPYERLRKLAITLPGVHDLLPSYRCVDDGTSARRLTVGDVTALGGDEELASEAFARRERLLGDVSSEPSSWSALWPLVGVGQRTMQSLVLAEGIAEPRFYIRRTGPNGQVERVDRQGDETVYREAAAPAGVNPFYLTQTHGALPKMPEVIAHVCSILTGEEMGPPLAARVSPLGLEVSEFVTVGAPFEVRVTGVEDPAAVTVRVIDVETGMGLPVVPLVQQDKALVAQQTVPQPGLYRVEAKTGGPSPVTQLLLAERPDQTDPDV